MAKRKILIRKEQKKFVPDINREITLEKSQFIYLKDTSKDAQTAFGNIAKKDLQKKPGSTVKSTKGKDFTLIDAGFVDDFKRIKRLPQTMSIKDIGQIIAMTGVNKDSIVIDAGAGSGALACYMAHLCKKVISYDVVEQNVAAVKENAVFLGLKNLTVKKGSIYEKIPEKNADLVVLDVPEPAKAINTAANSLKVGGFVVAYTIQATQLQQFANAILKDKRFLMEKNSELMERLWKVHDKVIRPHNFPVGHTGFLTFARKIC